VLRRVLGRTRRLPSLLLQIHRVSVVATTPKISARACKLS
jgi:hypothetical protein